MKTYFQQYSEFEDSLIRRFHRHPFWQNFARVSNERFISLLLQLGHLSSIFVMWYERAKQTLSSESGKEILREILRDEIPHGLPTHQDDRLTDLEKIGVSKVRALNTKPTRVSTNTIKRLMRLVRYPQADHDLRVLITLRIAGEVLVAETYRHVVPALTERFGMKPKNSKFYYPHFAHDDKAADGHTAMFNALLAELITDERTLKVAKEAATKAFAVRNGFYDQFTTRSRVMDVGRKVAAIAATLVLVVWSGSQGPAIFQSAKYAYEQHRYSQFLRELDPAARKFYVDCDRWLVTQSCETGNPEYLDTIGTMHACERVWGDV